MGSVAPAPAETAAQQQIDRRQLVRAIDGLVIHCTSCGRTVITLSSCASSATRQAISSLADTVCKRCVLSLLQDIISDRLSLTLPRLSLPADAQLKAAGFTALELKVAKFRAAELRSVGFQAHDLHEARFKAADLKMAGFTVQELKQVHYTASEMREVGYSAAALKAARYSAAELKDAGFTLLQLKQARFKASDMREAGYPATETIAVGYTFAEMKEAGYPAAELLRCAGYSALELVALRYTLEELRTGAYTFGELHACGYQASELREAGFVPSGSDNAAIANEPKAAYFDGVRECATVALKLGVESVARSSSWFGSSTARVTVRLDLSRLASESQAPRPAVAMW